MSLFLEYFLDPSTQSHKIPQPESCAGYTYFIKLLIAVRESQVNITDPKIFFLFVSNRKITYISDLLIVKGEECVTSYSTSTVSASTTNDTESTTSLSTYKNFSDTPEETSNLAEEHATDSDNSNASAPTVRVPESIKTLHPGAILSDTSEDPLICISTFPYDIILEAPNSVPDFAPSYSPRAEPSSFIETSPYDMSSEEPPSFPYYVSSDSPGAEPSILI